MPLAPTNGIQLYYETHGDPANPALLLVNGLGSQMTNWGEGYCEALAARGRFVITFDNRDVGLSTHLHDAKVDLAGVIAAGRNGTAMPRVPYLLSDMANDAVGLLEHLDIGAAHIAGSSMGGMIVQQIAIDHPSRVLTLTSVMSTTGEPDYFKSTPEADAALGRPIPPEREAYIADAITRAQVTASPRYFDPAETAKRAGVSFDRAFDPVGRLRQIAAIRASGHRADGLRALQIPTLVIHGRVDPLILLLGGERTAAITPGANLMVLNDMSHDLPRPLWPLIHDAILSHTTHAV